MWDKTKTVFSDIILVLLYITLRYRLHFRGQNYILPACSLLIASIESLSLIELCDYICCYTLFCYTLLLFTVLCVLSHASLKYNTIQYSNKSINQIQTVKH